jgi:hypothetical protein
MICFYFLIIQSVLCSHKITSYNSITKESMKDSFNFIIHGDWGWNSINQSLSAYQMGIYGDIIDNKFVIALGDNVSNLFFLKRFFFLLFFSPI